MSLAFKEGIKIPTQAMEQIVTGANQDVRQVRARTSLRVELWFLCLLLHGAYGPGMS